MRDINKTKILTEFASYFDIKSKVPTSFDSIPTVNNQNATYYNFKGYRNEDDIDKLWDYLSMHSIMPKTFRRQ